MEDGEVVEGINEGIDVKNWRNFARNFSQFTRPVSRPTDHEAGRSVPQHNEEVVSISMLHLRYSNTCLRTSRV